MISSNGTLTTVVATVGAVNEQKAVTALQKSIVAQPSLKGNTWLGGPTVAGVQIASVSSQDLGRAELYALPFLLLLLFFVFPRLRAAAVPWLGPCSPLPSPASWVWRWWWSRSRLRSRPGDRTRDWPVGRLQPSHHLPLPRRGRTRCLIEAALATVRRTAGHTVLFSSLTIAAALATLAVFPERFVYSMGSPARSSSWLLVRSPCSSCWRS